MKINCLVLTLALTIACGSKSETREGLKQDIAIKITTGDTLGININRSSIQWKGTKMRGLGKHEGTIKLKSGYLLTSQEQIVGGEFIIDMQSIDVTDIPAHEPIPRNNLINHLKSEEFFNVEVFPKSTFLIISVEKQASSLIDISGLLTMKGITNPISFQVKSKKDEFTAQIELNRFDWNIAYEGSWIDRTLVDKIITLEIALKFLN